MRIINVCRLNKTLKKRNIISIGNDGLICGVWYGRGVRSIIIPNFELLKSFSCGIQSLDDFIHSGLMYSKSHYCKTYVVSTKNGSRDISQMESTAESSNSKVIMSFIL